jgi:hypothetical protein
MSRTVPVTNLTVRHIWEAYASKLLTDNPGWQGKLHNKIRNFYIYRTDEKRGRVLVISYTLFRKVIEVFFTEARKAIIYKGEAVHINECGRILAIRVQRNHAKEKKPINWALTRKQPLVWDEALNRFRYKKTIYYTNDDYSCISWAKLAVRNSYFYTFEPTRESSTSQGGSKMPGFRKEFGKALTNNKLLKFKYLYHPLKYRKKENLEDE